MDWTTTAPTEEELDLTSNNWASSAPTEDELKETAPQTLTGLGKNLWQDVLTTGKGLGTLAESAMGHPVDTAVGVAKALPGFVVNEGKRIGAGELLTGHPINAVKKLEQAGYDKPLSTALDLAPAAGVAGKVLGLGGEGAEMANVASDIGKVTPLDTLGTGTEAGVIPTEQIVGNTVMKGAPEAATKITPDIVNPETADPMQEVRNYLDAKYGSAKDLAAKGYSAAAKQPGWSDMLSDYLNRWAQNMSVKNIGGSPRQVGELGPEASRAVGQFALDKGITAPTVGDIGMERKITALVDKAGSKVGAYRKLATERAGPISKDELLQAIKTQLDPTYTKGVEAGQKGAYAKALQEVERADMTHEGLAKLSTKLNKAATDAKRLQQASGATTDVANAVTRFNNAKLGTVLNPQEMADYKNALNEFGMGKKLQQFNAFKQRREIGGRLGPGGGVRHLAQEFLDQVGYRAGARIASNMAKAIRANPGIAKSLPSMFGEFVDQVHDLLPEDFTSGHMAAGGIVGNEDLDEVLESKYGKKEKK